MTIKELTIVLVTEYERSGSLNRVCSMMATMLEYAYKFSDDNTVHWQASFSDKYNAAVTTFIRVWRKPQLTYRTSSSSTLSSGYKWVKKPYK